LLCNEHMIRSFKFKLYRTKKTCELAWQAEIARQIWNRCLAVHRRYYRRTGKYLNRNRLQKRMTVWKTWKRFSHWNELGSQAIQDVSDRLEKGYKAFFKKDVRRPPRFKSEDKRKSFTLKQAGWGLNGNEVHIGNRTYKFHKSREVLGKPKTLTIKKDRVGDWWISISCEVGNESETYPKTGRSAGFDFGLKTFLTSSDGETIGSPQFLKRDLSAIRRKSRNHSTKVKGSSRRRKSRVDLARANRKIVFKRDDWQWKLADRLAREYDCLFFEDLSMTGMKALWGRKVSDLGFAEFVKKVEWLARKRGKRFGKIDRWAPTSKKCGACGQLNHELTLSDRTWKCGCCGAVHDRDGNAANNILELGRQLPKEVA
jgi:putative transposase